MGNKLGVCTYNWVTVIISLYQYVGLKNWGRMRFSEIRNCDY